MKKTILLVALVLGGFYFTHAQQKTEFKILTVVESIVPGGVGRSRIIENGTILNADDYTTERTDGKKSDQKNIKRSDAKVDKFKETKLLNFYSVTGINFQNIASNDALIVSKLNKLAAEGWELMYVTSGVESDAGETDGKGIFITRFYFKK